MREIKFRAWILNPIENEPRMVYDDDKIRPGYHCGVFGDFKNNGRDRIYMQFTGLKDKNGKDIYEGDILRDGKGQNGHVLWHGRSYLVEWQTRNNSDGHKDVDRMLDDCFGYGEIVGNIYENPELLK